MVKVERERIELAARIYRTSKDAGRALGIAPQTFSRLCRTYGIPTPAARRQNRGAGRDGSRAAGE